MPNPFEQLSTPHEVEYDEWGGAFSCQYQDCWEVASIAKYIKAEKLLVWQCKKGHISRIEGMNE